MPPGVSARKRTFEQGKQDAPCIMLDVHRRDRRGRPASPCRSPRWFQREQEKLKREVIKEARRERMTTAAELEALGMVAAKVTI
jgi:hypothetical protein